MTKFGPKMAFLFFLARPCRFFRCPVGGSVGGCGARAVSRKTPIYFIITFMLLRRYHAALPVYHTTAQVQSWLHHDICLHVLFATECFAPIQLQKKGNTEVCFKTAVKHFAPFDWHLTSSATEKIDLGALEERGLKL